MCPSINPAVITKGLLLETNSAYGLIYSDGIKIGAIYYKLHVWNCKLSLKIMNEYNMKLTIQFIS